MKKTESGPEPANKNENGKHEVMISRSVYPESSKNELRGMAENKSYLTLISSDRLILAEVRTRLNFFLINLY